MKTIDLLMYMDTLRYDRKLTQEDYLYGIVSQRQYYRYLYGESEPPFEAVVHLSKRLGLSTDRLITKYQQEREKTRNDVQLFFNYVISKNNKQAQILYDKISISKGVDDVSKMFLDIGVNIYRYNNSQITKHELVDQIKSIIGFDRLMSNDFLLDIEMYVFGLLMEYSEKDRSRILDRFFHLSVNNKLFDFGNRLYISQVYFFIIKNLGRENRLNDLIYISEIAIKKLKKEFSYYLLADIIYYRALAFYKLGDINNFEVELCSCVDALKISKRSKYEMYKKIIKKDTGYDIDNVSSDKINRN